jgi:hypothetical protein
VTELSPEARRGLRYAKALANNAQVRSRLALFDQHFLPPPLTVAELAIQEDLSPIEIHKTIKRTRIELFGKDLSESAIYYRLKHRHERHKRTCRHTDCDRPLSPLAPVSRLYCDEHGQPKHRTRRHRSR